MNTNTNTHTLSSLHVQHFPLDFSQIIFLSLYLLCRSFSRLSPFIFVKSQVLPITSTVINYTFFLLWHVKIFQTLSLFFMLFLLLWITNFFYFFLFFESLAPTASAWKKCEGMERETREDKDTDIEDTGDKLTERIGGEGVRTCDCRRERHLLPRCKLLCCT